MKVALRAATHLDFTEFPQANGSRHGVVTAFYYTLAWFDRYLRGADDALGRLVARRFDDSADVHNISGGRADPATGGNLPARIAGQPVADRLSFHFRSAYFLDGGRRRCENMRAGCPPRHRRLHAPAAIQAPPAARTARGTARRVYVNGRRVARRRGRRLRAVRLAPLPGRGTFVVRIVARTNRGYRVIAKHRYKDCKKVSTKRVRLRAQPTGR